MAKLKTAYFCQNCGTQYSQWMGQCKNCGQWNTLVEEVVEKPSHKTPPFQKPNNMSSISLKWKPVKNRE
jgi:DNA repair protein RadA/Sms